MKKVLVGYASVHGSTRGIADRIAERLRSHGVDVECSPVNQFDAMPASAGIVLGSAIHDGHWLTEAEAFVQRNHDTLARRPVWLFSVSLVGDEGSAFPAPVAAPLRWLRRRNMSKQLVAMRDAIAPREHRYFAGAVEREHWDRAGRAFFAAMRGRYGDHRDWPAVDAWADRIVAQLSNPPRLPASSAPSG